MTAAATWNLVEPHPGLQARLGIRVPPMPVRTQQTQGLVGTTLNTDALLDELDAYLKRHAAARTTYSLPAATMCYLEGVQRGRAGDHDEAAKWFHRGLTYDPTNLRLHANLAISLAARGQPEDALKSLEAIIKQPDVDPVGPVWMLAAKLQLELGETDKARAILDELGPRASGDLVYWDLYEATVEDGA